MSRDTETRELALDPDLEEKFEAAAKELRDWEWPAKGHKVRATVDIHGNKRTPKLGTYKEWR